MKDEKRENLNGEGDEAPKRSSDEVFGGTFEEADEDTEDGTRTSERDAKQDNGDEDDGAHEKTPRTRTMRTTRTCLAG